METGEDAEYNYNGSAWQTSLECTDLTARTTYAFWVRYGETDTRAVFDLSDAAEFVVQRSLKSSMGEHLSGGSWNATRAEMAVMLQQFVKLTEK